MIAEPIRVRERWYRQLTEVILLNEADRRRIARLRVGALLVAGGSLILPALLWTPVDGDPGAPEFFRRPTPHEAYFLELARAGTGETAGSRSWFEAASRALDEPLRLGTSHLEEGLISPGQPRAWSIRVLLERGQRLAVAFPEGGRDSSQVFVDLYRVAPIPGRRPVPLLGGETDRGSWSFEPIRGDDYVLRLQPSLQWSGPYRLSVRVEPSLHFPVAGRGMESVGSFFGDPRDGGRRVHRGVDIFAPRGTPVLAAADGIVLAVDTTNVGGRVVWQRTSDGRYGLYYAHLDQQLVQSGQEIRAGDAIGRVGNTGNARTTPPHLHFGVYGRREGALDPWYFIAPVPSPNPRAPITDPATPEG